MSDWERLVYVVAGALFLIAGLTGSQRDGRLGDELVRLA